MRTITKRKAAFTSLAVCVKTFAWHSVTGMLHQTIGRKFGIATKFGDRLVRKIVRGTTMHLHQFYKYLTSF